MVLVSPVTLIVDMGSSDTWLAPDGVREELEW